MAAPITPCAPVNEHYPHLFKPIELAGRRLKNRIVHASISLHFGAEHGVPNGLLDYHGARAAGGAAMIVTEPIGIARHQGTQRVRVFLDHLAAAFARPDRPAHGPSTAARRASNVDP